MWVFDLLQPLPGHFRSNDITSGNVGSRHVIFCQVTATSSELEPCRSGHTPKIRVFDLLQPLPCHFRSNDVTSGSLPVTWGHVMSCPVTWQPRPASYSPAGAQTYRKHEFLSLPGDLRWNDVTSRSLPVTLGHVTSFAVTSLPFLGS